MDKVYSKEVARYLNNKFGSDFTETEPYPYWMEAPNQEEGQECWLVPDSTMTEVEYKCWCDAANELRIEILCELGEDDNELKNE